MLQTMDDGSVWGRCACPACAGSLSSLFETNESVPGQVVSGKPVWSIDQVVANFNAQRLAWSQGTVGYTFLTSGDANFAPLSQIEMDLTRKAFVHIAEVAGIAFVEIPDDGSRTGRIFLSNDNAEADFAWGSTSYRFQPGFSLNRLTTATITLNPDATMDRKWFQGGYNYKALVHEILHAIGIPHPGSYNADGDPITYAADARYFQDSAQYTVMSYFAASNTGADHEAPDPVTGSPGIYSGSTLLLHDIAALQAKYGANMATRAGDTTYGFNSTAGDYVYDFAQNKVPIIAIWDGGGVDTLDLSGAALSVDLDLNEGAFSDALLMTDNIAIAYGAKIENARGGSAADKVMGNGLANQLEGLGGDDLLTGAGGDDRLLGGAGSDTAAYAGRRGVFDWWSDASGNWFVRDTTAAEGQDTLVSVEALRFVDRTVKLTGMTAAEAVTAAFENVLRSAPANLADQQFLSGLSASVQSGQTSLASAIQAVVARADATTSVATMAYQFFTGAVPTSAGLDFLVAPEGPNGNNLNSAYYQSFGLENRYINFAVNLGKLGEGAQSFTADYGGLTLDQALSKAYAAIFGSAPSQAKIDAILDAAAGLPGVATRADYFAYYGQDGLNGVGTKAAMVGWLLAEAEKADIGVFARSNAAFLTDLADGAQTRVDLIGVYGSPDYYV